MKVRSIFIEREKKENVLDLKKENDFIKLRQEVGNDLPEAYAFSYEHF